MSRFINTKYCVKEHLIDFQKNYPTTDYVGIFLQGSQNYELDYEGSDIDTKAIVLPSFEDFVRVKQPMSYTFVRENNEHIDLKDIRTMVGTFKKQNINFIEILFTKYKFINSKYADVFNVLINERERIARYDIYTALNCMVGMAMQKYKALEHPYPTTKDKIEMYGYDCYHQDTEFLTKEGWKKFNEIKDKEEIGTINPITHTLEFQKPLRRFNESYKGKMFDIETYNTHFNVTPNHNLFISPININKDGHTYKEDKSNWKLVKASDIIKGRLPKHNHIAKPINRNSELENYDEVKITDDLLILLGAFVSDGTVCFRDNKVKSIRLYQKYIDRKHNQDFIDMIDSIKEYKITKNITKARNGNGLEITWDCYDNDIKKFYEWSGHKSESKRLPKFISLLSSRQARILLKSLCLGDGTKQKTREVYYTINSLLADDIQLLSIMANKDSVKMGGVEGYSFFDKFSQKESKIYQVAIKTKESLPDWCYLKLGKNVKEQDYDGKIVCFEVPNHVLVTRYMGKVAVQGNCKQLHHILRMSDFMKRYIDGEYYEKCLIPTNKEYLIQVKKGIHTLEEARAIAKENIEYVQNLKDSYIEKYSNSVDEGIGVIMEEVVLNILKQSFTEQLLMV